MSLKETINNDLKAALRGGNHFVKQTLNSLRAVILNQEIAIGKREEGLNDNEIEQLITKEVKKRQDAYAIYVKNDRQELADNEKSEIEVLQKYLPEQMTEDQISELIDKIISENSIELIPQNMGKIIGATKSKAGASADGGIIAKLVKQKLN